MTGGPQIRKTTVVVLAVVVAFSPPLATATAVGPATTAGSGEDHAIAERTVPVRNGGPVVANTTGGNVTIRITNGTLTAGEEVTVQLRANATGVGGYQTNITFNGSLLNVTDVSGGDFSDPVANVRNGSGWVSLTQSRASTTGVDDPLLANITFRALKAPADTTLTIKPNDTALFNATGSKIPIDRIRDGTLTITAPQPEASVTPVRHEYGNTTVGETAAVTVTVRNTGKAPLNVSSIALSGPNATAFTITNASPTVLRPGASRGVTVRFAPTTPGAKSATLRIAHNDTDRSPSTVSLVGTAVPRRPLVNVTPGTHDYGDVPVGANGSVTVTIRNDGTAPLNVATVGLRGTDTAAFAIAGSPGGTVLEPGQTRAVTVRFGPTSSGAKSATLRIAHNDTDRSPTTVALTGTGVVPNVSVSPQSHVYGAVAVGSLRTKDFTITNDGEHNLTVSSLTIIGADTAAFRIVAAPTTPAVIEPGKSRVVTVEFAPSSLGSKSAKLAVLSNDPDDGRVLVSLSGTGVTPGDGGGGPGGTGTDGADNESDDPEISVSGDLAFGDVLVDERRNRTITVRNVGNGTLSVTGLAIRGPGAGAFSVPSASFALGPGEQRTFTVTFAPSTSGRTTATLAIRSNDPDAGTVTLGMTGTGTAPELSAQPTAVRFGNVTLNESATRTVTLRNTGTANLTVQSVTVGGPDAGAFSTDATGFTLAPGQQRTLTVAFAPTAPGKATGELSITSVIPGQGTVTTRVTLTGTAAAPDIAVRPSSINFGNVTRNRSVTRTITVENRGTANLTVGSIQITGPDRGAFSVAPTSFSLVPGAQRSVNVTFAPTTTGSKSAYLTILSDDPDDPGVKVWLSNTRTSVAVSSVNETGNTSSVNVTVRNASANETISLNVSSPETEDDPIATDNVNVTVGRDGNFSLNITTSTDPINEDAEFNRSDGTEPAGFINITHTIDNRNVSNVSITFRLRKSRINRSESDPEDVALYRFENGSYRELPTTFIRETATHYVFRAMSPGLSDFTVGVKKAKFEITNAVVTVTQLVTGEGTEVLVRITNEGGADGQFNVKLLLNDEVVETRQLTIAANGTRQVRFDRTFDEPGTYELRVNNVTAGTIEVSEPEGTTTATGTAAGTTAGTATTATNGGGIIPGLPGFGPVVAIVAIVIAILLVGRKREG